MLLLRGLPPSLERAARSSVGARAALSAAAALTGAPLADLLWARAHASARPDAVRLQRGAPSGATASLSYDGPLLLLGFAVAAACGGRVGVDVLRCSRAAAALAAAGGGCGDGAPLLRARAGGRLPTAPAGRALPPAALFALRWTLLEAVLKARGEGLAVEGAAEAVLEGAEEARAAPRAAPRAWAGALRGDAADALGSAAAAAAAAAVAAAAGGATSEIESTSALPVAALAAEALAEYQGPGWRAAVFFAAAGPEDGGDAVFTVAVATEDLIL